MYDEFLMQNMEVMDISLIFILCYSALTVLDSLSFKYWRWQTPEANWQMVNVAGAAAVPL